MRHSRWLLTLFALSGSAGIIYEALWSHYLKLFLGHAAYAQAAVLVLFMGGLAGGAVEATIGVLALTFHPLYLVTIDWVQSAWLPILSHAGYITAAKFAVGAVLIFPQALLLGATFPLMTTGVLRRSSMNVGATIASLYFVNTRSATIDEATQVLSGVLPLAARPAASTAAVIGIGSGMTAQALLQGPQVARVDTIEIEPTMVDGARLFQPHVAATFDDPRSNIVIEDARSYFAAHRQRYDIIVSEPSNPWVSGVAGLFAREFYRQIKQHLTPAGVFAQWMQLYEISPALVATVFKALSAEFGVIQIYEMGDGNILLMAHDAAIPLISFEALIANDGLLRNASAAHFRTNRLLRDAQSIAAYLLDSTPTPEVTAEIDSALPRDLGFLIGRPSDSTAGYQAWRDALVTIANRALPRLNPARAEQVISRLGFHPCAETDEGALWVSFYRALARRETDRLGDAALSLHESDQKLAAVYPNMLVGAMLLDHARMKQGPDATEIMARFDADTPGAAPRNLVTRLLLAHAGWHEEASERG